MVSSNSRQLAFRLWKRCPRCAQTKINRDFPRNRSSWDGLAAYCKPCHNQVTRETAERLYGGHRNFLMQRRYGIDFSTFEQMRDAQGGLCALCRKRKAKHIDHVHGMGQVRAILCFKCNNGLGKLGDSVERLRAVIAYLRPSGT